MTERGCPAEIPSLLITADVAIRLWNRRSGSIATRGGRAQGISTPKKRRACRENLKRAREFKKLEQIKKAETGLQGLSASRCAPA